VDRDLREVRRVEHSLGWLHGICFDEEGNGYAAGREGVAKFDKAGRPTATRRGPEAAKVLCAEDYIYLFGRGPANQLTHTLYLLDRELEVEEVPSASVPGRFASGKPAYDGQRIYAAGYTQPPPGSSTQSPQPTPRGSQGMRNFENQEQIKEELIKKIDDLLIRDVKEKLLSEIDELIKR